MDQETKIEGREDAVRKSTFMVVLLMLAAACSAGCAGTGSSTGGHDGGQAGGNADRGKPKDPVTLTFYDPVANGLPENFMEKFGNAIQAKFPHITVKYVSSPDTNPEGHIAGMLSAGEEIDVLMTSDQNFSRLIAPFKFQYDLSDLIKSQKYDLAKLDPGAVKAVQVLSGSGVMYGLPISMNHFALLYNKDLFDKFGKPYPKDGMTWDEAYQLAQAMTRQENGVQYRGFITQTLTFAWGNQLSVGFVDPKTEKSTYLTDDRWQKFTQNLVRFYQIPGNALVENTFGAIANKFFKEQVAAMYAYFIPNTPQEVNWDLVKLPEFGDLKGVGPQTTVSVFYITSVSKHKEDAFEAVAYLTGDEFQMNMSKQALALPVSANPAVKNAFAQDAPMFQGKNVRVLLDNKAAAPFPPTPYDRIASSVYEKTMYKLGKGQMDVNTFLRQVAEQADKDIETAKSGSK
jgi:multiple sugar transport system substrate-binding protein